MGIYSVSRIQASDSRGCMWTSEGRHRICPHFRPLPETRVPVQTVQSSTCFAAVFASRLDLLTSLLTTMVNSAHLSESRSGEVA